MLLDKTSGECIVLECRHRPAHLLSEVEERAVKYGEHQPPVCKVATHPGCLSPNGLQDKRVKQAGEEYTTIRIRYRLQVSYRQLQTS